MLGLSQCRKQETPVQAGEKQYIELTASNGNDGSKVDVKFITAAMNLTWEEGDEITVTGGAEGTLALDRGAGTAQGHFSGEITVGSGELTFTYKKAAPSKGEGMPDFSIQDGTAGWIKDNICLEAKVPYSESGKYSVLMEMPYALLKLDLSALVNSQNDVTVKAGDDPVVTFAGLAAADAGEMFVALPAAAEKTYTFSGNDKEVLKTWTLEANTYYTADTDGGVIVIKPEFKFTVGEDNKAVEFAQGNLYFDPATGWNFEKTQWDFRTYEGLNAYIDGKATTTPDGNWGTFGWSTSTTDYGKSISTSYSDYSGDFVEWGGNVINGNLANTWRTPTKTEWNYLLNVREVNGNTGLGYTCAWATLKNGYTGLVIFCDDYNSTGEKILGEDDGIDIPEGCVFLPAISYRTGSNLFGTYQKAGYYWSSDRKSSYAVYRLFFTNAEILETTNGSVPSYGFPVRLVRDLK